MAQKLKAWAALLKDPGSVPSTWKSITASNFSCRDTLFWPPLAPGMQNTYMYKIKSNFKIYFKDNVKLSTVFY